MFQVEARDPDDPETSNGKIIYSLPDDGTIIRKLFQIDPNSGILTTKARKTSCFFLILETALITEIYV